MPHSFSQPTLETLRGLINTALYEQRQPRIPLRGLYKEMTIQEFINMLRLVTQTTDKDSTYNSEDTIEGNLSKKTRVFIPDNMDVMEVFNSYFNDIKSNNKPLTDVDDIGDRILQWGFQRDRLRSKVKQNFPPQAIPNISTISTCLHLPWLQPKPHSLRDRPHPNLTSTSVNSPQFHLNLRVLLLPST